MGLILGSLSINIPSEYKTFLGIPYDVNPQYANSVYEIIVLLAMGLIFLFIGIGVFLTSLYRASHNQPIDSSQSANVFFAKPPVSTEKKFCRYCGTENKVDAVFCEKCGKRIAE